LADNIIIPASGTGDATPTVATDDCGVGGHAQIVKLAIATNASATLIPGDATTGLYVNPTDRALRDMGKVDVASLDQYAPGQQLMAASLPVVLASDQTAVPVSGAVSFTAPQHIIADSGTITTVSTVTNLSQQGGVAISLNTGVRDTGTQRVTIATNDVVPVTDNSGSLTVDQPTGTNLHVVTDANSVTAATLGAETTKVIGTVRTADGAGNLLTTNSTTYTAKFGLDSNLLGTLGTAFTTAGFVDVKGADGNVFVRQATGTNLHAVLDSGTVTTVSTVTNLSQMGGVAISLNTGVRDTGTQRVTIATNDVVPVTDNAGSLTVDQATGTNLHTVVDSGTITTVSTVTAVSSATLAAETTKVIGTVRALGNAGAIFDAATGAAVPANVIYNGARAATANPTSATGGNAVGTMADKAGRAVVTIGHVRELVGVQTTNITTTGETTIVTAGGAGVFNDISSLVITNRTATAVNVTIKDATAGTTRAIYDLAASGGLAIDFNPPMPQAAAANNWTATLSASSITVDVNVVFVKNL
jgi:hypothetical protein